MLVHTCWHLTGSEQTLKHCLGEESTYYSSLSPPSWEPTQLLPSCSLFIPPSSGSTEKSQGWKRTPGTSQPGLCFSILEMCSSNLSIRTPSNGEATTLPGYTRILPSGKAKVVLAPRRDPPASCSLCTWGQSLAFS